MSRCRLEVVVAASLLVLAVGPARSARAEELTPEEQRGRQIYFDGTSSAGRPITAHVGRGMMEVPGAAMKCVGCHGADGLGNPESGIIPSNVTWTYLTKPYGARHAYGRSHPPYTEETAAASIAGGQDPAGNLLDHSMPRYVMDPRDMADLVAYLKRLGTDWDPGVGETMLVLGTVVPAAYRGEGRQGTVSPTLRACFEGVNRQGGVFNRKLELKALELSADPGTVSEELRNFIEGENVFALVGSYVGGAEPQVRQLVESLGVPHVAPFTLDTPVRDGLERYSFYLFPGMREQAEALLGFAVKEAAGRGREALVTVAYAHEDRFRRFAEGIQMGRGRSGKEPTAALTMIAAGEFVQDGAGHHTDYVLFLGSGKDLSGFLHGLSGRTRRAPFDLLAMGPLLGGEVPEVAGLPVGRVLLSYPAPVAGGRRTREWERFLATREDRALFPSVGGVELNAHVACLIVQEALKRAGRALSRETFVAALETFYDFETGLVPPITFSANRRIGVRDAIVVEVPGGR